jgi:hypothetical protein
MKLYIYKHKMVTIGNKILFGLKVEHFTCHETRLQTFRPTLNRDQHD